MIKEPAGGKVRLLVWRVLASRRQPSRNDLLDLINGGVTWPARQLVWAMGTEVRRPVLHLAKPSSQIN